MLKNNGAGLENKNGISPYVSWFVREGQELKRGGTAPINQSRKNRSNIPTETVNTHDQNDIAIGEVDSTKPVSIVTTSKIPNLGRIGTATTNNENHRITKVFNSSGINTYKLTRLANNNDEDSSRPQGGLTHAFGLGIDHENNPNNPNPTTKFEKRGFGVPVVQQQDDVHQEFANMFGGGMSNNDRNLENFQSNRPQTAHIKGSGAFRRGRILNESAHNYEDFQTPNTGNLELESLHNMNSGINNNKASERGTATQQNIQNIQNIQKEYKPKIGIQEGRPMTSAQHTRQSTQGENEAGNQVPKYGGGMQRGFGKGGDDVNMKFGVFGKEDSERERINNIKFTRLKTAEPKHNKAKQILGGRRYAEDMYTYNVEEPEDGGESGVNNRNTVKRDDVNEEKQQQGDNLVAMIGRSMQENVNPKRNERNERNGEEDNEKGLLDQEQFALITQKSPTQRPPARKNGQAMFLNNYAGLQEADKKAAMLSPTKGQQIGAAMRPPSRQKAPTKALGLDESDEAKKNEIEGDVGLNRREQAGKGGKHKFVKDNEFGLDDEDFENLEFDQVFDMADFLEGEEIPRGPNLVRPSTSVASQRGTQSSQSHRPIVGGLNKHGFLQAAKGRPNEVQAATLNTLLNNNKPEQGERVKTLKTQKDSGRLDSAHNANRNPKPKVQGKGKNDMEVCDILSDHDSDSNHSQEAVPKRISTAQPASIMSKGQSSKLLESEKMGPKPLAFKDKKSQIVFIYNKESHGKKEKEKIDLPFETTLEKDFVGLFAN